MFVGTVDAVDAVEFFGIAWVDPTFKIAGQYQVLVVACLTDPNVQSDEDHCTMSSSMVSFRLSNDYAQ